MKTVREESPSETDVQDDGCMEILLQPGCSREICGNCRDRRATPSTTILLPPPPSPAPEKHSRRRPSAPSIFHHLETAFTNRRTSIPQLAPVASRNSNHQLAPGVSPSVSQCSVLAIRRPSAVAVITPKPSEDQTRLMDEPSGKVEEARKEGPKIDDTITVYLSAMYAKLLVFMGIAFPITETIALESHFYQGFYLYLYTGTFLFLGFMYGNVLKARAVTFIANAYRHKTERCGSLDAGHRSGPKHRYGSFYLRLGAVAFGIGSMVYSGLEFGQYWELRGACRNLIQAITPAARMLLTLVQMQFIFLNNKEMDIGRHKVVAQFGLMHMIATNLCEWLNVIIEEAKHEIEHLPGGHYNHHSNHVEEVAADEALFHNETLAFDDHPEQTCVHSNIMGTLVRNAAPFLFPCTIEYSLICAVVLFEMWKNSHKNDETTNAQVDKNYSKTTQGFQPRSVNHLSVDCTKAHTGLFAGIVVMVLTIISLILFFVLNEAADYQPMSLLVVNVCELTLYILTTIAVLVAFFQMRSLKYQAEKGLGLDNSLLVMAQTGMFMYCLFSIIAYNFTNMASRGMIAEMCGLVQTICQTIFVLDAWRRRCSDLHQLRAKPGRQMVTFLLVANMAMWIVNTLEKSRAEFRPTHLEFYGVWAWTIITHISMPLAIFYRFHSTICLFEIWKCCYKVKLSKLEQDPDV